MNRLGDSMMRVLRNLHEGRSVRDGFSASGVEAQLALHACVLDGYVVSAGGGHCLTPAGVSWVAPPVKVTHFQIVQEKP